MTWVKLDDAFATHPKIMRLSDKAFRLHVRGLCYASFHLTDGFVPVEFPDRKVVRELVAGNIWSEAEGGYIIHDFLDYNRTREQILAEREASALRQAKFKRDSRRSNTRSNAPGNGVTSLEVRKKFDGPVPEPVPEPQNREARSSAPRDVENPNPVQPTHDQLYLAEQFERTWPQGGNLTPAAIVSLNKLFGRGRVEDAMRELRGFPPAEALRSAYAYLTTICEERIAHAGPV